MLHCTATANTNWPVSCLGESTRKDTHRLRRMWSKHIYYSIAISLDRSPLIVIVLLELSDLDYPATLSSTDHASSNAEHSLVQVRAAERG